MTFQAVKAVIRQDRKALFWLVLGYAILFTGITAMSKHAGGIAFTRWYDEILWVFWGLLLGAGIRARDFRTEIHTWLDALPARPAGIIAVRFIWRLLIAAAGAYIFLIVKSLVRWGSWFHYPWPYKHYVVFEAMYLSLAAFCLCALFAAMVRKEFQAMGLGLLAFALVYALYDKLMGLYGLFAASHVLIALLVSACFLGCLWAGWKNRFDFISKLWRAVVPLGAGIILATAGGWLWSTQLASSPLSDMAFFGLIHPAPAHEGGIIEGSTPFMGEGIYSSPWLVAPDRIEKLHFVTNRQGEIKPSPDGKYYAIGGQGLFTHTGEYIRPLRSSGYFSAWSPDSRLFAYLYSQDKLCIMPVDRDADLYTWQLDRDTRKTHSSRFILAGWLNGNTLIVAQVNGQGAKAELVILWALSADGHKESIWRGPPWGDPYWTHRYLQESIIVYPGRSSVVLLEQQDDTHAAVAKEILTDSGETLWHGEIHTEFGYCALAAQDKSLLGWSTKNAGTENFTFHTLDLQTGERRRFPFPPFDHSRRSTTPRISPNGRYLAANKDSGALIIMELISGAVFDQPHRNARWAWTETSNLFICCIDSLHYIELPGGRSRVLLKSTYRGVDK